MNGPLDLLILGDLLTQGLPERGAVGVADGRIAYLGSAADAPTAKRRLDRSGCWLLPGAIDAHVHTLSTPAEGITRATAAAAAGGVTTIIDMPFDDEHPINSAALVSAKAERVGRERSSMSRYSPRWRQLARRPWARLRRSQGRRLAFKLSLFEAHPVRFPRLPDDRLYEAFQAIARTGLPAAVHAENQFIIDALTSRRRAQGPGDLRAHGESRPPVSRPQHARALALAHWAGVHLPSCISASAAAWNCCRARADGVERPASMPTLPDLRGGGCGESWRGMPRSTRHYGREVRWSAYGRRWPQVVSTL